MRQKGLFITFEGVDGVGKTTQLTRLMKHFQDTGRTVVLTKEPGDFVSSTIGGKTYVGSNVGNAIRAMLFTDPTTHKMAPGVADLLFLADHVQNQWQVINPALESDCVVLSDRYADSEYAYAGEKATPVWALRAFDEATTIKPDITILLLADPEEIAASGRLKRLGTIDENKQAGKVWADVERQVRIQAAYVALTTNESRFLMIEVGGNRSREEIATEIATRIEERLTQRAEQLSLFE